jgi:hypothetical protein
MHSPNSVQFKVSSRKPERICVYFYYNLFFKLQGLNYTACSDPEYISLVAPEVGTNFSQLYRSYLWYYDAIPKVAGSIPDEVTGFFSIHQRHYGSGIHLASNINENQESSWREGWPAG